MPEPQPRLISNRAADDLTYIRSAMERSSAFTAVPGAGGVVTGVIGLIAAVVGARQPTGERWLATWLGAASIAVVVELAAMTWKARRAMLTDRFKLECIREAPTAGWTSSFLAERRLRSGIRGVGRRIRRRWHTADRLKSMLKETLAAQRVIASDANAWRG